MGYSHTYKISETHGPLPWSDIQQTAEHGLGDQHVAQVKDTVQAIKTPEPVKPTPQQIRYRRMQTEKKMFIGDSHFLPAKTGAKLHASRLVEHTGLQLPVREKNSLNTDWLAILFLLSMVLLVSIKVAYSKYITGLFQSVINYPTAFRLFREGNYPIMHGTTRLELFFYLVFGIFVYQMLNFTQYRVANLGLLFYLKVLGFLILYFFLKKTVYSALGSVFNAAGETAEFLFNVNNFNRALGISMFPVVALVAYFPSGNPEFIAYFGILLTMVFYLLLLKRGISILLKKQFSIFYLFLYLCTLEFLPLLLIYKVVVD